MHCPIYPQKHLHGGDIHVFPNVPKFSHKGQVFVGG